jgi:hypothetical protein
VASLLAALLGLALVPSGATILTPFSLGSGLAGAAYTAYEIPPHAPPPDNARARMLLRGSRISAQGGWIVVDLYGGPYQIGFQNGFLTAQSAHYWILVDLGTPGSTKRETADEIAKRIVWAKVPRQYQLELEGIAAGLHAAGYRSESLWDVVAANDWADQACYATLLHKPPGRTAFETGLLGTVKRGCSAFIATGAATADGRPVMGHDTWSSYDQNFMYNVIFHVEPTRGYAFTYQSAGGQIWSGQDFYENSAGLMLTETSLATTTYRPAGVPIFVRARQVAQYAATVSQAVSTLLRDNDGAYSAEWLIGDRSGEIASLQLGCRTYNLHRTHSGFFGSSNYAWGSKGKAADPPNRANSGFARYLRWGELRDQYYGRIDVAVAKTMLADTYDTYLGRVSPDQRTICGEPENASAGAPYSGTSEDGAYDAKVCTESMVLGGLQLSARWGHPDGDSFSADSFLRTNPGWAARHGPLAVFGLRTFAAQTPDPWVLLRG